MNPFTALMGRQEPQDPTELPKSLYVCTDGTIISLGDIAAIMPDGMVLFDSHERVAFMPKEDREYLSSRGAGKKEWMAMHEKYLKEKDEFEAEKAAREISTEDEEEEEPKGAKFLEPYDGRD